MSVEPSGPANTIDPEPVNEIAAPARIALVGNPNVGKTTLFNRICGVRAKTANFPGSTVEARVGPVRLGARSAELVDLPGVYGIGLSAPESVLCRDCLDGRIDSCRPDAVLVVLDAQNLLRGLRFALEVLRGGAPAVVAVNLVDVARRRGLSIDPERLERHLGCPVIAVSGRTGEGVDALLTALGRPSNARGDRPSAEATDAEIDDWIALVLGESAGGDDAQGSASDSVQDRLDAAFTHPILGIVVFGVVMVGLFTTIFSLANIPMALVETLFASLRDLAVAVVPEGAIADLLTDGVIGGLEGTLIFLPQICLLFFLLTLLEDTGYLARAAFVMDRLMCRFGLPGQAFVPLLSSHACALPGIMSARLIPDRRDRLATILVAPFMSCTARIPVYVLLTSLLFGDRPLLAGLAFTGCYVLGAVAALATAFLARRTILPGRSQPMILELPSYRWPSLRTAVLTTWDRAFVFLKNAGTVIMGICIAMWWLSAYPKVDPPAAATALLAQADAIRATAPEDGETLARADALELEADHLSMEAQQAGSFAGRIGSIAQPVFAPIGLDERLSVAVLTSFLAREVFVSTTTVLLGAGDDTEGEELVDRLRASERSDGTPLFDDATSAGLLVFYVLAMQCLPTLAVTRRETGSWKWPMLQLGYMSSLAWVLGALTYWLVGVATGA